MISRITAFLVVVALAGAAWAGPSVPVYLDIGENVVGVGQTATVSVVADVLDPASPTDGLFSYDLNVEFSDAGHLAIDPGSIEQPDAEDPRSPGTVGPTGLAACYGVYFHHQTYGIGETKELVRFHVEGLAPGTVTLTVTPDTLIGADFTLHESDDPAVDYTAAVGAIRIGTRADLLWTGAESRTWDVEGAANWSDGVTPCPYRLGDHVTFDDTAAPGPSVTLVADVTPGSVTVASTARDFAFEGPGSIGGACGLAKDGTGTLTLATGNTYAGDTLIRCGTVMVAAEDALGGGPSTVRVGDTSGESGAAVLAGGPHTIDRDILVQDDGSAVSTRTLGGTHTAGASEFAGSLTVLKDLMLTAADGGTVQLTGDLDNTAGKTLTKVGDGALEILGPQHHGAGAELAVLAGTVFMGTDGGGAAADLSISVTDATLTFGCSQHLDTLTIGEGGKVVLGGADVVVLKHLMMGGVDLGAVTLTPEPTTLALLACGGLALLARAKRRR